MLKKALERFWRENVYCPPSFALQLAIAMARLGRRVDVPVYGLGDQAITEFYGVIRDDRETARLRLPWGKDHQFELSYHFTRTKDGRITVVREGFFPNPTS